jgi:hypothetical protein
MPTPAQSIYLHVGETEHFLFTDEDSFSGHEVHYKVGKRISPSEYQEVLDWELDVDGDNAEGYIEIDPEIFSPGRYETQLVVTEISSGRVSIIDGPVWVIQPSV